MITFKEQTRKKIIKKMELFKCLMLTVTERKKEKIATSNIYYYEFATNQKIF